MNKWGERIKKENAEQRRKVQAEQGTHCYDEDFECLGKRAAQAEEDFWLKETGPLEFKLPCYFWTFMSIALLMLALMTMMNSV